MNKRLAAGYAAADLILSARAPLGVAKNIAIAFAVNVVAICEILVGFLNYIGRERQALHSTRSTAKKATIPPPTPTLI